jgi:hypothetical protein
MVDDGRWSVGSQLPLGRSSFVTISKIVAFPSLLHRRKLHRAAEDENHRFVGNVASSK